MQQFIGKIMMTFKKETKVMMCTICLETNTYIVKDKAINEEITFDNSELGMDRDNFKSFLRQRGSQLDIYSIYL